MLESVPNVLIAMLTTKEQSSPLSMFTEEKYTVMQNVLKNS